eukprot:CFRG5485T1
MQHDSGAVKIILTGSLISMKLQTFVAVAALSVLAQFTRAVDVETEDGVYVLGDDTLEPFVQEHEFVLAEFYAPWCGHCKQLAPEYAKAAQELAESGSTVKLAKIDSTIHSAVSEEFDVKGYPTIKFFRSGHVGEYEGGRTHSDIINWLSKKTGPPAETIDTVEKLNELSVADDAVVVGVFDDLENVAAKTFLAVAASIDDVIFGISSNPEVRAKLKVEGDAIALLKHFDEKRNDYEGEFETDAIKEFINVNRLPLVMEFNEENQPKIFSGDINTHMLLFVNKDSLAEVKDCYSEAAAKYRGKAIYITVDTAAEDSENVLEYFNVDKSEPINLRLINMDDDMIKFVPENPVTCNSFTELIQGFIDGTIERHLNSEDVPEDWNAEPVKILVGKNFHEIAFDESKDVFVEFYAPWCGHCKSLAPIWEQLAEEYEGDDTIVIAKMDSTANEVAEVSVEGFPTLKFFPKNAGQKIIDYDGDRTLEDLRSFLNKSTVTTDASGKDEAAETETEEDARVEL